MSSFGDSFDSDLSRDREGCTCGYHMSQQEHAAEIAALWQQRETSLQSVAASEGKRHHPVGGVIVFGKTINPALARRPARSRS
jgi:hypothetical protein